MIAWFLAAALAHAETPPCPDLTAELAALAAPPTSGAPAPAAGAPADPVARAIAVVRRCKLPIRLDYALRELAPLPAELRPQSDLSAATQDPLGWRDACAAPRGGPSDPVGAAWGKSAEEARRAVYDACPRLAPYASADEYAFGDGARYAPVLVAAFLERAEVPAEARRVLVRALAGIADPAIAPAPAPTERGAISAPAPSPRLP